MVNFDTMAGICGVTPADPLDLARSTSRNRSFHLGTLRKTCLFVGKPIVSPSSFLT